MQLENTQAMVSLAILLLLGTSQLARTQDGVCKVGDENCQAEYPCQSWCESDIPVNGKDRHCHAGDMKGMCGGCQYCRSYAPPKAPTAPLTSTHSVYGALCKNPANMSGGNGFWAQLQGHPSCTCSGMPGPCFKNEGVHQCEGDRTAISMDLRKVGNKQGCYAYHAIDHSWNISDMKKIYFNAEWDDFENLWMAPIWMCPGKWIPPQGLSGEIDFIESCRSHQGPTVGSSIICHHHGNHPDCKEPQWGFQRSSGGPLHFEGSIDETGTWRMYKSKLDGTERELISQYPNYLQKIQWKTDYKLVSDIWNGGGGDEGWRGCGTLNKNTQCRFTVANIKVIKKGDPDSGPARFTPTPPTRPTSQVSGGAWNACRPGAKACCDPTKTPAQICPGGQKCQACGGSKACECPTDSGTAASTPTLPTRSTPPVSGGAWSVCPPGAKACCDPSTTPAQICPGGQKCQACGGSKACECPAKF